MHIVQRATPSTPMACITANQRRQAAVLQAPPAPQLLATAPILPARIATRGRKQRQGARCSPISRPSRAAAGSGTRNSPAVEQSSPSDLRAVLKQQIAAEAGARNGLDRTPEQRAEIRQLVAQLEPLNPSPEPAGD